MFDHSPTIQTIRDALNACSLLQIAVYLPDLEKIKAAQREVDECLKIDPEMELKELLKCLKEKRKEQAKPTVDGDAAILTCYEKDLATNPKPARKGKKGKS